MRVLHVGRGFRPWRGGGLIAYAEGMMGAQVQRGHAVGYFFSGRRYPLLRQPRLRRWERDGIRRYEILNTSLVPGGEEGTAFPADDVDHPPTEGFLERALDDFEPDLVHVQELFALPSSVVEVVKRRDLPVVMTLQDYFPLCPTIKLYDIDGQVCLRDYVGPQCVRCSAAAPTTDRHEWEITYAYEMTRLARVFPPLRAAAAARKWLGRERGTLRIPGVVPDGTPSARAASVEDGHAPAEAYQRRRERNVDRLNQVDVLVAMSNRVAEIYHRLGVDRERLRVLHLTLDHLDRIPPVALERVDPPVRFATLNGCASTAKGAGVVLGAVRELHRRGLAGSFELRVAGYVTAEARRGIEALPGVEWVGHYAPERLESILDGVHVGVVPSIWEEAYGYVGPELLARGIPVVGNAIGGIVDYVREGETGWLNRTCDAVGLADLMERIVRAPEQVVELNRRILAARGELIKPLERHADELEALYREVVARRAPAPVRS